MGVPRDVAPHPALVVGWLLAAAASAAGVWLVDEPVVGELTLAIVLLVLGPWLAVRVHRRQVLPGVDHSVPVGLVLWGAGHLLEAYRLASGDDVAADVTPADALFVVVGTLVAVAATGLLWRSVPHLHLRSVLRSTMDSVLITLAVTLLYWWFVVLARFPDPPAGIGTILVVTYVAVCSLMAAALVIRAVQRRESGSWLLALAGVVPAVGMGYWGMARLGGDGAVTATSMFLFGCLVLPLALVHPGHRHRVTVREGHARESLWAVGFHLGAWGVFFALLGARPMDRLTPALATASVAVLFLRIFLVRLSERNLYEQLRTMAFTDSLTGAANRRGMLAALAQLPSGWLVSVDLDGFKQVNDQHGHDVGDGVLEAYVHHCRQLLPPGATLARVGGDEFAVLGPGTLADGVRVAESLVRAARMLTHQGVTASAGVAQHQSGIDPTHTMRDADIALQRAKQGGKNRVETLDPEMKLRRLREITMVQRLRDGMADLVHPHFQPIVDMADPSGAPVGVEALARWDDPVLGPVPPAEFIEVCERHGLICELGDVMLGKILAQLGEWVAVGAPLQVTFNVSWLQLRDEEHMARMRDTLARVPHLAPWLVVEVTEGVLADDDEAARYLHELRELGVVTAMDDFGTGASSLTRLRHLPVDVIKVDRALLAEVGADPSADSVLELVQRLGTALGLSVIVEGVETREARDRLVELGFRLAQGYFFDRPMPAHDLPATPAGGEPPLGRRAVPARSRP